MDARQKIFRDFPWLWGVKHDWRTDLLPARITRVTHEALDCIIEDSGEIWAHDGRSRPVKLCNESPTPDGDDTVERMMWLSSAEDVQHLCCIRRWAYDPSFAGKKPEALILKPSEELPCRTWQTLLHHCRERAPAPGDVVRREDGSFFAIDEKTTRRIVSIRDGYWRLPQEHLYIIRISRKLSMGTHNWVQIPDQAIVQIQRRSWTD